MPYIIQPCVHHYFVTCVDVSAEMHNSNSGDAEAVINSVIGQTSVLLCCPTKDEPVDWKIISKSTPYGVVTVDKWICENDKIMNGFNTQFSFSKNATGCHNLVIKNTSLSDSGLYECIEEGGSGLSRKLHLKVSGKCFHF